MQESEAKKKWCPMTRVSPAVQITPDMKTITGNQGAVVNRAVTADGNAVLVDAFRCVGSRCMMWKVEDGIMALGDCGLKK